MAEERFSSKVVYYGGFPGSSGKPVTGRLAWQDGVLGFTPRGADGPLFAVPRDRLLGVRRSEEGMSGARRVRLVVEAKTEPIDRAPLKFEMATLWRKEACLQRWLDLLNDVLKERNNTDV